MIRRDSKKILSVYFVILVFYSYTLYHYLKVPRSPLPEISRLKQEGFGIPVTLHIIFVGFKSPDFNDRVGNALMMHLKPMAYDYATKGWSLKFKSSTMQNQLPNFDFKTAKESSGCTINCFFVLESSGMDKQKETWIFDGFKGTNIWTDESNVASNATWSTFVELVDQHIFLRPDKKLETDLLEENKYIFSFTLLNSAPKKCSYVWDFDSLYNKYLYTVISKMDFLDIKIDSQVLNFGDISTKRIRHDVVKDRYFVRKSGLNTFVGNTHWNVETPDLGYNRINLLVYIPDENKSPLEIRDDEQNVYYSFIAPKWGIVAIYNPEKETLGRCEKSPLCSLTSKELRKSFNLFVVQLRVVLGLEVYQPIKGVKIIENKEVFTDYEIRGLKYHRIRSNFLEYRKKLFSLYQQFNQVEELPIDSTVKDLVTDSLTRYDNAVRYCTEEKHGECLEEIKKALDLITEAYFNPLIMAKLHFSFKYMIAVFAPFFVTSLLPILKATITEFKIWMST